MKVLLILDNCIEAQEQALAFVREMQAELSVLFVLDATWNVFLGHDWLLGSDARADFMNWMRDEEVKASDGALAAFAALAAGTPYSAKIAGGDIQEEILKEAANGYDLLIVANPLQRGLERVRKAIPVLAEKCPCNLLLVKRK